MPLLTDDMVVEILSRLPLKSFCRFKCVCKSWLAFSSDPHYRQKIPRTPAGLLYQNCEYGRAVHLSGLPSGDREIDTTLRFVPDYNHLKILDCKNGLLLCPYAPTYDLDISRFIVCIPATEEWTAIPHNQKGSDDSNYYLVLCFDPLWSQHFYVFKFWDIRPWLPDVHPISELEVFSSQDFTWHSSPLESEISFSGRSHFIHGVLYLEGSWDRCVLTMDAPDTCTQLIKLRTIQLPGFSVRPEMFCCYGGRLAQSSGVLCYAQQEIDGCMMRIWNLEGSGSSPEMWVVKHRLNMSNAFGRDILFGTDHDEFWCFDYDILAFDLESEVVILAGRITHKFLSFSISTGKLLEIQTAAGTDGSASFYYVPYYRKFPASVRQGTQEEY